MSQKGVDTGKKTNIYHKVDKRYHDDYTYQRIRNGRTIGRKRFDFRRRGPNLLIASLLLLSLTLVAAASMGLFTVTEGKGFAVESEALQSRGIAESLVAEEASAAVKASAAPEISGEVSTEAKVPEHVDSSAADAPPIKPPVAADAPMPTDNPEPEEKVVYLTFDDGPCKSTEKLLDMLDQLDVKAIFYVTGQYGTDEETVARMKEMHKRGHAIGIHSYSHNYKEIYASADAFMADLKKMDDLILEATGERSHLLRFPGGSNTGYNEKIRDQLLAEVNRQGYSYCDWNASNGDSDGYDAAGQIKKMVNECKSQNRSIVLMHNTPDKDSTINTLPEIVRQLREAGYRFDLLDETVKPIQFKLPVEATATPSPVPSSTASSETTTA